MQHHGNRSQITGELPQSRPRRARPTPQNQAQALLDGVRHRLDTGDITASSAAEHIAEELFHWNTAQASAEPIDFGDCRGFEMPPRRDPDRGDQPPADSLFAVVIETEDAGPRRRREIVETVRKLHRKHVESRAKADGETATAASGAVIVEVHRPQPDERRAVHRLHLTACRSALAAPGGADSARETAPRRPARAPETKIVYGIALDQPTKGHVATIARAATGPGRTGRSHTAAEWAEAIDVRPVSDELFQRIRNWFAETSPTTKPVDNQLGLPVVRRSTLEDDRFTTLYLVRIVSCCSSSRSSRERRHASTRASRPPRRARSRTEAGTASTSNRCSSTSSTPRRTSATRGASGG